jgi:hypothetical protein
VSWNSSFSDSVKGVDSAARKRKFFFHILAGGIVATSRIKVKQPLALAAPSLSSVDPLNPIERSCLSLG